MRKISTLAVLAVVLLFSACGKDSGEVKLLESITQSGETTKFEYDDKNRIIKMGNTTITYKSDDLVIIGDSEYKRNGNEIIASRDGSVNTLTSFTLEASLTLEDGFITSIMPQNALSGFGYTFVDGNLDWNGSEDGNYKYKYDDKKSPFNCNTPKWIIQSIYALYPHFWPAAASKNNVVEVSYNNSWTDAENYQRSYKYEYDSDGFPTKRISGTETIATFTYRKGKKVEQKTETSETKASPSLVQTMEFNGKKIPMTVFYSSISDNETSLDSLMFEYDGKAQTVRDSALNFADVGFNDSAPINVSDYNFDGYLDFSIYSRNSGTGHNNRYETFIYNPKIKEFSHHPMLSDMVNVTIDSKAKTIKSYSTIGGNADLRYSSQEYKWINGQLTLTHSVEQDYGDLSQTYILRITKTLKNGKLEETREISDDNGDTYYDATVEPAEAVKIGDQTWMSKNLNNPSKGGKCYEDKPENCEKYGRLYNWDEAMKACPSGWHLPSDKEWQTLVDFAGGMDAAAGKLKAKSGWEEDGGGSDEYGFSALPGGYGDPDGSFSNFGGLGIWWTSEDNDFAYIMYGGSSKVGVNYLNESLLSVRCIKD